MFHHGRWPVGADWMMLPIEGPQNFYQGQQSSQVIRQPNQMTSVIQQRMQAFQGYPGGPRNVAQQGRGDMMMMQSQPSRIQMMPQQGQVMPGQFVGNSMPAQFHLSAQQRGQHMSQLQAFNQQMAGSPGNLQSTGGSQQSLVSQQHLQQMQPSPALAGSGIMIPSPANLNIPSQSPVMQPHLIGLSPSSRVSLSSPGSHLGTPGNPGSVPIGSGQLATEEQEYLQRWEYLQKYLEPLKKMISKIDKEEDKKMDLNKMKNLLDILTDKNKRLALSALVKCEAVLEKQLQVTSDAVTSSANTSSTGAGDGLAIGQDLYDTLVSHKKSPTFNHTMAQTFGFTRNIIYFPKYEEPEVEIIKPPFDNGEDLEVEDPIQLEVARLNKRFVVNIDDSHFPGSDYVVLSCKLDDDNLPAIPPFVIHLPKGYPFRSPQFYIDENVFGSSELFRRISECFKDEVSRLLGSYSLTTLMNLWEIAVRKSL